MLSNVITIYLKELKEILRDRRTLVFMILMPCLVMPLILKLTTSMASKAEEKAGSETIRYALINGDQMPGLAEAFAADSGFELVPLTAVDQIKPAIREGKIGLGLVVSDTAAASFAAGEQIPVDLFYNNASLVSKVKKRASAVIDRYSQSQRNARLETLGVKGSIKRDQVLEPVTIRVQDVASSREVVGTAAGGFLAYMFIIFCFMGCLYPALDLGAGEKERGTLETLLLVPVPRFHLVLGKFGVLFTCGVTSSTLSVGSMAVFLFSQGDLPPEVAEMTQTITLLDMLSIGSMMIPIAGMFAALLLSISIFGRSFKEAQSYATPMTFLVILPAMLGMIPGVELTWKTALIPITNIALAMKELAKGTMDYGLYALIMASSTAVALALLAFCSQWFNREQVLFRE